MKRHDMERRRRDSKAIATEKGTFGIDDRLRRVYLHRVQGLLANASATRDILWDQRSEGKRKILMRSIATQILAYITIYTGSRSVEKIASSY